MEAPQPRAYPIPSCHAVVLRGDAVLLVQRARDPFRGYWGLPGGKVELGETVEQALVREVAEETSLTVVPERLITYRDAIDWGDTGDVDYHFVMFYFVATAIGGELQPGDDAEAVRWTTAEDLHTLQLVPELPQILAAAGWRSPSAR